MNGLIDLIRRGMISKFDKRVTNDGLLDRVSCCYVPSFLM